MENQNNKANAFQHKRQPQDTNFKPIKLNPVFDDLNNPITADVIQNHVEGLQKTVEAEQKAKQNPFPVEVFPEPIQEIITATNESLNFPIDFIGASILYAV